MERFIFFVNVKVFSTLLNGKERGEVIFFEIYFDGLPNLSDVGGIQQPDPGWGWVGLLCHDEHVSLHVLEASSLDR